MDYEQQFSLRWNNYLSHMTDAFESLREEEDLVDVTLSCEGKKIKAHKMLLSACSSYFKEIFKENPCQHPVIIFRNVKYDDLESLVSFIYQGEVSIAQERLSSFLNTAELLAVRGLTAGTGEHNNEAPEVKEGMDSEDIVTDETSNKQALTGKKTSPPQLVKNDNFRSPHKRKRKPNGGSECEIKFEDTDVQGSHIKEELELDISEPFEDPLATGEFNDSNYRFPIPSDDSGEGITSFDQVTPGTSTDGSFHDPLQVFAQGLWRRLHPSMKQFGCDECGKVFKHPRSLDHHKKMHEGRTTCPVCQRVFGRMYALRLHLSSSHPDHSELLAK